MRWWLINICLMLGLGVDAASYSMPYESVKGLMVIEAQVGDLFGKFVFDSGANSVIVHGTINGSGQSYFQTVSGTLSAALLDKQTIALGQYERTVDEAYKADLQYLQRACAMDIKGIVGGHIFTPHAIIIDRLRSTITIETTATPQAEFDNTLPFTIDRDFPLAEIEVGKKTYQFIIDSGCKSHHVSPELLIESPSLYSVLAGHQTVFAANGQSKTSTRVSIDQVSIGTGSEHQTIIALVSDFGPVTKETGIRIDGILSVEALSEGRIVIDLDHRQLLF